MQQLPEVAHMLPAAALYHAAFAAVAGDKEPLPRALLPAWNNQLQERRERRQQQRTKVLVLVAADEDSSVLEVVLPFL